MATISWRDSPDYRNETNNQDIEITLVLAPQSHTRVVPTSTCKELTDLNRSKPNRSRPSSSSDSSSSSSSSDDRSTLPAALIPAPRRRRVVPRARAACWPPLHQFKTITMIPKANVSMRKIPNYVASICNCSGKLNLPHSRSCQDGMDYFSILQTKVSHEGGVRSQQASLTNQSQIPILCSKCQSNRLLQVRH